MNIDIWGWLIIAGIAVFVFWITRTLVLWYFGIEELTILKKKEIENQERIINLLEKISTGLQPEQPLKTPMETSQPPPASRNPITNR